ncbi:unnamed protein product [Didymodactylos carnosus]|uniref:Uncharacterized protein n=1 Tax=Didymodactylos carnosus TaxID=1234261 RepID=A0A814CQV9_9BILA|nr:unnamed protein product [Didymodactylos carnosus]CAF0943292.1 unnamed protein product [Didymodactylos carnosus]CAF3682704.1 unnamed protein product [Didymodactylos carnosus]CAF3719572.1 unnamed protein product [Didymodactylos carnosus]
MILLAQALLINTSLEYLLVSNNDDITDQSVNAITEMLKQNRILTWLNLCNNDISKNGKLRIEQAANINKTCNDLLL